MPSVNFTNVQLRGAVVDQAAQVPSNARIQLRVYAETGNGLQGNGGADGQVGLVDVAALTDSSGRAKSTVASLNTTTELNGPISGGGPFLLLGHDESEELLPGTARPLYTDLFFTPLGPDNRPLNLLDLRTYVFTYTAYLPVRWLSAAA